MTVLALYIVYMRARRLYPQILLEQKARSVLDNSSVAGESTSNFEVVRVRRGGLVEAAVDGDRGPFADAPSQFNAEYDDGGVDYKADLAHSSIEMVPTKDAGEDGRWSQVEERERRQAAQGAEHVYGPTAGDRAAAQPSFTHLPLQGAGEDVVNGSTTGLPAYSTYQQYPTRQ